ncbi:hypothetical protein [Silanimonas sp.]|uniref:hypothetical protein n=1 Tax=Silanimonas sp. TaxID=1929290 RepID=UPI0037CB0AB4
MSRPATATPMSAVVKHSLTHAADALGVRNPLPLVGELIEETFRRPSGDRAYARNALAPGAVPYEPSFSESEPDMLRFTIEPLGPDVSPASRRDESTRQARRLIGPLMGRDALRWFDERSEAWRGVGGLGWMSFGAWFGSAFDEDGLYATKVYYELLPQQLDSLPPALARMVRIAISVMPGLVPIFTSIGCARDRGSQRVTFLHRGALPVSTLGPLMNQLGIGHQLPSLMRVIGVALGGRFELPPGGVLIGLRESGGGVEMKLEVLLPMIPDLPTRFLDLLKLGLAERPRQMIALERWLQAFELGAESEPGQFSVLSVRVTPQSPARVSVYVRPIEFELRDSLRPERQVA